MSSIAIVLLLASAFSHAGWNMLSKKEQPTLAFFMVASFSGFCLLFPFVLYHYKTILLFPGLVWWAVFFSGACLTLYYSGLVLGYNRGEMSVVYPIARALPVLFVAFVTSFIGRVEPLSTADISGMVLVVLGCLMVPLPNFSKASFRIYKTSTVMFCALMAAVGTAGYAPVDDSALHCLQENLRANPLAMALLYACLQSLTAAIGLLTVLLCFKTSRANLFLVLKGQKRQAMVTGVVVLATYALVLVAMMYVTNVSYVVVFRQLSIPIGVCLGIFCLGEKATRPKVVGVILIFIGLLIVGLS